MDELMRDPFASCESAGCNHDLGRGVLIEDLFTVDGPFTNNPFIDLRHATVVAVAEERPRREAA